MKDSPASMVTMEQKSWAQLVDRTEQSLDLFLYVKVLHVKKKECPPDLHTHISHL